jgi:hypothetical protein
MSIQEHVILVNDQGMVIGTQEKYAAHTLHTPLHLAFSSWLFNANGECLITRRALTKSLARRLDQLRLRPPAVRRRDDTGDNPPLPL